jgi:SOS response regulatory protein OraA/RecX
MWKKRKEIKPDEERVIKDAAARARTTFDRAVNLLAYKPRSVVELRNSFDGKRMDEQPNRRRSTLKLEVTATLNDGQFCQRFRRRAMRGKHVGQASLRQKLGDEKARQGNGRGGD